MVATDEDDKSERVSPLSDSMSLDTPVTMRTGHISGRTLSRWIVRSRDKPRIGRKECTEDESDEESGGDAAREDETVGGKSRSRRGGGRASSSCDSVSEGDWWRRRVGPSLDSWSVSVNVSKSVSLSVLLAKELAKLEEMSGSVRTA